MARQQAAALYKLSDVKWQFADPAEDIRRRTVADRLGDEIGTVDDLLIDDRDRKVRFLQVASGSVLGLGETKFLLPVNAVTRITSDTVHIDRRREQVVGAPRYDPELGEERNRDDL